MEPDPDAVAEERRRLRRLRMLVDFTALVIVQAGLTRAEAEALVAKTRARALELFPDGGETFDLILRPRFARLVAEFTPDPRGARARPFPPRPS